MSRRRRDCCDVNEPVVLSCCALCLPASFLRCRHVSDREAVRPLCRPPPPSAPLPPLSPSLFHKLLPKGIATVQSWRQRLAAGRQRITATTAGSGAAASSSSTAAPLPVQSLSELLSLDSGISTPHGQSSGQPFACVSSMEAQCLTPLLSAVAAAVNGAVVTTPHARKTNSVLGASQATPHRPLKSARRCTHCSAISVSLLCSG